ncbi:hypothetical protein BDF19DRAFT_422892 [Syncephalis fuscata]|nr:hypothetical protein BDF19DRAFT_422892 [Syncephalis fuscata]
MSSSFELSMGSPALSDGAISDGPQVCLWRGCGKQVINAEDLFIHVTEDHVGRNATGNLCLQCQWADCTISKSKRDHLISHIKSHLSYKPYGCGLCDARFKHQSDLKRHEHTHRDKMQSPPSTDYDHVMGVGHFASMPLPYGTVDASLSPAYALPPSPMSTPGMHSQHYIPMASMSPGLTTSASSEYNADTQAIFPSSATGDMIDPAMLGAGPDGYLPQPTAHEVYHQFLNVAATQQYTNADLSSGMMRVGMSAPMHTPLMSRNSVQPITLSSSGSGGVCYSSMNSLNNNDNSDDHDSYSHTSYESLMSSWPIVICLYRDLIQRLIIRRSYNSINNVGGHSHGMTPVVPPRAKSTRLSPQRALLRKSVHHPYNTSASANGNGNVRRRACSTSVLPVIRPRSCSNEPSANAHP